VALKREDSGVNFSARIKGALKLCGLNFDVPCSATLRNNCVSISEKSNGFDICSDSNVARINAMISSLHSGFSYQIEVIHKLI